MSPEAILENPWLLAITILWVLPWKGFALWKAAGKKQKWWFIAILIVNTLAILEILYIFVFSEKSLFARKNKPGDDPRADWAEGSTNLHERRKERILEAAVEWDKVTNNAVEKLVGVSDSTATRYLQELVKEGKLEQIGEGGRGVFYRKK